MQTQLEQRIEEIKLCLFNEDLNRTGQRLLDLTYDYNFNQSYRDAALNLRKLYNEGKQLGKIKNENEFLLKDYSSFFESIAQLQSVETPNTNPKNTIAKISNIGKRFRSSLHNFQFSPISLDLVQGNIIGLVGENGNGKLLY